MTPITTSCRRPFMKGDLPFGCGQCLPCRIKKRRMLVHTLSLEHRLHGDASFLTLTHDPKLTKTRHNNNIHPEGHLVPKHLTDFIKRLRRNFTSNPIRYFAVGEYGERSQHPHYHAILFGYPTCTGSMCTQKRPIRCEACQIAHDAWSAGNILNGDVTKDSLSYVASYVTKGLTQSNEFTEKILKGRPPEFTRRSLRPGLGAGAAQKIAEHLSGMSVFSEILIGSTGDVPGVVETDQRPQPLSRYLRQVMRRTLGWTDPHKCPEGTLNEWKASMQELYKEAAGTPTTKEEETINHYNLRSEYWKRNVLAGLSRDAILNIESKFKKYNLRGAL